MMDVAHIKKYYGKKRVLEDVTFQAVSGERIAVVGKNGCGKSTLLQILSGMMKPDKGTLSFYGKNPFSTYFILEYKRSIRALLSLWWSLLLFLGITIGGTLLISVYLFQAQVFQPVPIGVVVSEEVDGVRALTRVVAAMDSVKKICTMEVMNEADAIEGLQSGELEAAIVLEDEFYEGVYDGKFMPVDVMFAESSDSNQKVFRELLKDGVSVIRTSQAALFATVDASSEFQATMSFYDMENYVAFLYIKNAFARNEMF